MQLNSYNFVFLSQEEIYDVHFIFYLLCTYLLRVVIDFLLSSRVMNPIVLSYGKRRLTSFLADPNVIFDLLSLSNPLTN